MVIDRIGNWAWALTPAERLVSVAVSAAHREGAALEPRLARRYEAMRTKQAKLLARGYLPSGPQGFGQASRRGNGSSESRSATPGAGAAPWGAEAEEGASDESAY